MTENFTIVDGPWSLKYNTDINHRANISFVTNQLSESKYDILSINKHANKNM